MIEIICNCTTMTVVFSLVFFAYYDGLFLFVCVFGMMCNINMYSN
jgi:hypothetical protein